MTPKPKPSPETLKPGAYILHVGHDEGCPCLAGKPMPACTCKEVTYSLERLR